MRREKKTIDELVNGMYVAELDRPWTDTPFMFQGFVLRSDEQRDTLRKFCQWVYVDLDRDERAGGAGAPATPLTGIRRQTYAETTTVESEVPRARQVLETTQTLMMSALRDFSAGSPLDVPAVKQEVKNVTDSVLRNPNAVTLLTVMSEGAEYLLDRAMHTSVYVIVFARFLGMDRGDIERAGVIGLLQDIAMAKVPRELVTKAGALAPDEMALVRRHVDAAVQMLSATSDLGPEVAEFAGMHHERYDGSGYPRGLRGAEIPTLAACCALVDTYSAMTRARPYAAPIPPSKALGILHRWRGKTFHDTLVEEFIRCIGAFPVGSVVELNTGEIGVVISQDPGKRLQPRVVVVRDPQGQALNPQKYLDLSRLPKASADEPYRIRRTIEYGRSGVSLRDLAIG